MEYLNALKREECYRVDAVMKKSAYEVTQRVYFVGANGSEQGPFIRKYIKRESGLGSAYRRIHEAQRDGRRFRFIPFVFDCYDTDEFCVVLMEYVAGETLADVVGRRGASPGLAREVFPRLCDAVSELHEGFSPPIIHRDLKPSNVILSRDGFTLIDFGIARAYRCDADFDTVRFGTRAYAPPEQFGYRQTDVRSDEYALGMLLYFCLTGKTPDARACERGFVEPEIPLSLRKVLLRATAFDPDDRFSTVRELGVAFSESAEGWGKKPIPIAPRVKPSASGAVLSDESPSSAKREVSSGEGGFRRLIHLRNPFPLWAGLPWNTLLLLLLAIMGVSGFDQIILHPTGEAASLPTAYNAFLYVGIMVMLSASAFALFDKRLLVRRFSVLHRVQGLKGLAVGFAVALASFIVMVSVGIVASIMFR